MTGRRCRGQKDTSEDFLLHPISVSSLYFRYFGRAKDLPGVRELFQSRKKDEEEENQALAFYKKFLNQGPSYFGDLDEKDPQLLKAERVAEQEGICFRLVPQLPACLLACELSI
jgi:hypothetical protein